MEKLPKMYGPLARWWHLLSPPSHYRTESVIYRDIILKHNPAARTVLELGCGGGNNASHLKQWFTMTLTDISGNMLDNSRKINPECEHIRGDMRDIRLKRLFDVVFINDAIGYMTTHEDLVKTMTTAFVHCNHDGCLLIVPDFFKETFKQATNHGGSDDGQIGMRYLEWVHDPNPDDNIFICDFAFLLREDDGSVSVDYDRHILGLFTKDEWLGILRRTGFDAEIIHAPYNEEGIEEIQIIFARKTGN